MSKARATTDRPWQNNAVGEKRRSTLVRELESIESIFEELKQEIGFCRAVDELKAKGFVDEFYRRAFLAVATMAVDLQRHVASKRRALRSATTSKSDVVKNWLDQIG